MNIFKKILKKVNQILALLFFALLLLAIYGKIQMMVTKQEYSTVFGYTLFQVASNSMEPTMSVEDVILVHKTTKIKSGDIISFVHEGTIITHRILNIDNDLITVKGDANNTIDEPIKTENVIGKVVKIFPELKIWQQIFTSPKILISLFLTLLLFDFAFSYKKGEKIFKLKKKKNQEKEKTTKQPTITKIENDVEIDDLFTLTGRVNLERLDEMIEDLTTILDKKNIKAMNIEELKIHQQNLENLQKDIQNNEISDSVQKETLEYTIRLDLKEIQKQIAKKVR